MNPLHDLPFEAFFLDGSRGRLFALHFPALGEKRGALLCIPPFAEESNRSRVMLGMAARALAAQGWSTLLLDPYGCGDSEGHFEQADWATWQQDIDTGVEWLNDQDGELGLWGLRLGAFQVIEAAARHQDCIRRLLLWQPVTNPRQMFTQYLRLRLASTEEATGKKETTADLRARLADGEALEIGGYYITGTLAAQLDEAALPSPQRLAGIQVDWLERVDEGKAALSIGSRKIISDWRKAGVAVTEHPFTGPPFWQLHDRFLAPQLTERTVAALTLRENADGSH